MRNHHQRDAMLAVEFQQQVENPLGSDLIEIAGGFVSQYQRRFPYQCPSYGDPLPLPTGQIGRETGFPTRQTHQPQLPGREKTRLTLGNTAIGQGQCNVIQSIEPWQQIEGLKNKTDFPIADESQLVGIGLHDVVVSEPEVPARRSLKQSQYVEQRALTGT